MILAWKSNIIKKYELFYYFPLNFFPMEIIKVKKGKQIITIILICKKVQKKTIIKL